MPNPGTPKIEQNDSTNGPFDGVRANIHLAVSSARFLRAVPSAAIWRIMRFLGDGELTFLGNALESFGRALDPILAIIAFGRKLPDDLIGTAGGRTRNIARGKVHRRSNREFVLQRPLHHAKCRSHPRSRCAAGWKTLAYSTRHRKLASGIPTWQTGGFPIHFNKMDSFCRPRGKSCQGAKPAFF